MRLFKNNTDRRQARVRRTLKKNSNGRVRLSVFRSSKHIYAQLINDANGQTVAAASTLEKDVKGRLKTGAYMYHGRIKELADAAREGGLSF